MYLIQKWTAVANYTGKGIRGNNDDYMYYAVQVPWEGKRQAGAVKAIM